MQWKTELERQGNPSRKLWLQTFVLLFAFAVIVCLRMPEIVIKGRFWAEEGQIFFHNAWTMPPAEALFTSYAGYMNLVANAAPLAARWLMPLPLAPYLTIATALVFQLCPPLLLLTASDSWLRPLPVRMAAILLVLLVPEVEEVWLQTLHCQFQLMLCCGIILALDAASGWLGYFRLAPLFLAPLCGPGVIVLLPLFFLRALLDRSRIRLIQAVVLGAAASIQLSLFFHLGERSHGFHPVVWLCVFTVRHFEVPLLGVSRAVPLAQAVKARLATGHVPWVAALLPILIGLPFAAATLWRRRSHPAFWFLAACGLTAAAAYFGALGGASTLIDAYAAQRYVFVPQALLSLAILAFAATASGWTARLFWVVAVWLMTVGAYQYAHPLLFVADGPSWRDEVALWRADPSHVLQIWPAGWTVRLGQPPR